MPVTTDMADEFSGMSRDEVEQEEENNGNTGNNQ